jgi:phosphatidylserine synthase
MRRVPTVAEVLQSYKPKFREELAGEWASALLYRPPSLVLTPLFIACGATPTAVTLLALACALALPWIAWFSGADAWPAVALLAIVFCVLDCVDGNVARVMGRASMRGAYADFTVDNVYRVALYAALGMMIDAAERLPGHAGESLWNGNALAVGLVCAWLAAGARLSRLYVQRDALKRGPRAESPGRPAQRAARGLTVHGVVSGIDHLMPLVILALGYMGVLPWILAYLLVYSAADFVHTQWWA